MRDLSSARCVKDRTQNVRDVRKRDNTMLLGEHLFRRIEVDLALFCQWYSVNFVACELPGHDVAMMLELREEDAASTFFRKRARNEINRFGCAAGKDKFVRFAANQPRGCRAGSLVACSHCC